MTDLPNWAVTAFDALFYAVFGPPLILYAVVIAGGILFAVVYPIWGTIRGHSVDGPLHPVTRLVLGLIGAGLLWSFIVPWL